MNLEKKRKLECLTADCGLTKERCLIHHGSNCIKLGGKRIPLQTATPNQSVALRVEGQTNFKAYWIADGWAVTDWRD